MEPFLPEERSYIHVAQYTYSTIWLLGVGCTETMLNSDLSKEVHNSHSASLVNETEVKGHGNVAQ